MPDFSIFSYPVSDFPFGEIVKRTFDVEELERLHEWGHESYRRFDRAGDQQTIYHKRWYDAVRKDPAFLRLYKNFLSHVIVPKDGAWLGNGFLYQKIPTFRVHLPNNVAVGEWHRDSDYGHPESSWNYWVPLTMARGSSTIWIEFGESFEPQNLEPGQALRFNGATLLHGNVPNLCDFTRVSFDFRVLPLAKYNPERAKRTVNTKQWMTIGDFYERYDS